MFDQPISAKSLLGMSGVFLVSGLDSNPLRYSRVSMQTIGLLIFRAVYLLRSWAILASIGGTLHASSFSFLEPQ